MEPFIVPIFVSVISVYTIVSLYNGANQLVRGVEPRKKSLWIFLSGVAMFALFGGGAVWFANSYNSLNNTFADIIHLNAPQLSKEQMSNLSADDLKKYTRLQASSAYLREGRLVDYVGGNGEQILYQPTQAELSEREDSVKNASAIETMNSEFKNVAAAIITTGVIAIICGLFEGFFARTKARRQVKD